jgi:hypothetical protein
MIKKSYILFKLNLLILFLSSCLHADQNFINRSTFIQELPENQFVVVDFDSIRSKPSSQSEKLISMRPTELVEVIKITNLYVYADNKRYYWCYVDSFKYSSDRSSIKGWISQKNLSHYSNFTVVDKFMDIYFDNYIGEALMSIQFYKNGIFIKRETDEYNKYKYYWGKVSVNKKVVSIQGMEYFYLDENNVLWSQLSDENGNYYKSTTNRGKYYNFINRIKK